MNTEATLEEYARNYRREQKRRWAAAHSDVLRESARKYRARHKTPVRIEYTPPATPPPFDPVPDWRTQLDARISRCPGCDEWRFDQRCRACLTKYVPRRAA